MVCNKTFILISLSKHIHLDIIMLVLRIAKNPNPFSLPCFILFCIVIELLSISNKYFKTQSRCT